MSAITDIVGENRKLLKKYADMTEDKQLARKLIMTEGIKIDYGFQTREWHEDIDAGYIESLKRALGSAVTVTHSEWEDNGPSLIRSTDIKINLADENLKLSLEAFLRNQEQQAQGKFGQMVRGSRTSGRGGLE